MATIYEVAAKAGVSPATVSRVFSGLPVSPEKIDLVRAASRELSYSPNKTAQRLRNQTSEVVGLLIPDIENPFFTALARGVEDVLQAAGYSLVLCNTDEDPAKETHYLDIANSENMAGVILAPVAEDGDIRRLTDRGRPVVAVDRNTGLNIDAVMVDNRAAGMAAANALFEAGYHRIACIAGPVEIESTEERTLGWRQVVTKHGDDALAAGYLQHANYRVDGGRAAMQALLALDVPPDAVVTTNNLMGVGAIQVLSEAGIVPPQFGVAVIGDLPFTTLSPRAITQVHLPARHLGTTAATMLLERITGDKQPARTVVLRAEVTLGLAPADAS
jgi:LacI family transcriptional regulator